MSRVRADLHVALLELPATWGRPDEALSLVDAALSAGPRPDLVLLPEASLTGYVSPERSFDLTAFAEPLGGPCALCLAALAKKHTTHLVGPVVERGPRDRLYNAMIGFSPDGRRFLHYRKRHPWFPETWAAPGEAEVACVDVLGWSVAIAICFDVHFLIAESSAALHAADLLLFPSAWVEEHDSRPAMLADLARAFDLAIANANWGPGVVRVAGQGGSAVYARDGSVLARAEAGDLRLDVSIPAR